MNDDPKVIVVAQSCMRATHFALGAGINLLPHRRFDVSPNAIRHHGALRGIQDVTLALVEEGCDDDDTLRAIRLCLGFNGQVYRFSRVDASAASSL